MSNPSGINLRATLLIVDDEPAIRRFLRTSLAAQDYAVIEAETGAQGLAAARRPGVDLMILDLGLPDRDGLDIIADLRMSSALPIIVLSSRGEEASKVEALDLGADDYIVKPFSIEELLARIRVALRHRLQTQGASEVFTLGPLTIDLFHRRVLLDGAEVKLSPKEWGILAELAKHPGRVLTHKHLLKAVWGHEDGADVQYLRVYVRQLRQKLHDPADQPRFLLTEAGVGYRLAIP
jgi:two-component system KDP operon response regulator KdpE